MVSVIRVQPLARSWNAQFMRTHGAYVEASISVLSEYSQWPTPDGWVGSVANLIADMRPPHTHRTALCCLQPSMQWARKASRSTRNVCLPPTVFRQHKLLRFKLIQQGGDASVHHITDMLPPHTHRTSLQPRMQSFIRRCNKISLIYLIMDYMSLFCCLLLTRPCSAPRTFSGNNYILRKLSRQTTIQQCRKLQDTIRSRTRQRFTNVFLTAIMSV